MNSSGESLKTRLGTAMIVKNPCLLVIATLFVHNEASRILAVFPTPSISHQVVFRPLITELVNRGHEVVHFTTDPIFKNGGAPVNLTEIDLHDISYDIWTKNFLKGQVTSGNKDDLKNQISVIFELMLNVFEAQMAVDEIQAILKDKSQKFDLLLLEAYFMPLLALAHVYKAPVIQVSSMGSLEHTLESLGALTHPLVYPTCIQQKLHDLNLWEKVSALHHYYKTHKSIASFDDIYHSKIKQIFGADMPSMHELQKKTDMVFFNIHPMWESNRPVPPNVIFMGGMHQKPAKELPEDLKKYLDSSKHGVIYISFGTNVDPSQLPPRKIQTIINSVSKLPYDVLWKWNKDELPGRTPNIRISKWLPQSDLLRHPKVKLFITQGGLQSTDEAITAGVPLIGMPMLGDQWFNVEQYVHYNIGVRVDMDTISEEILDKALHTILKDDSYRQNVARLRTLMRDEPQTPLERAVWWTEYVIRHSGAGHLRAAGANMTWFQYYEVELVSYLVLGVLSVITLSVVALYFLYSLVFKQLVFSIKVKKS